MNTQESTASDAPPNMTLFWGCFVALITTSFAFITRAFLVNDPNLWPKEFGLDKVQAGELFGAGIWPFAISIILFSLIIDRIGYKAAMWFSFICYALYAVVALEAYDVVHSGAPDAKPHALSLLTMGSISLGLGNGTVEAFINPVVATMFRRNKTKWLNILHAGWPGGLVGGGFITLMLGDLVAKDWRLLVYIIALPVIVYVFMLARINFPVNERVAVGATYREMLAEFGVFGAAIAGYLVTKQVALVFGWSDTVMYLALAIAVGAFGLYCRSLGRVILVVLCLIMIPLATTELGTDGAISGIMTGPLTAAGFNGLWVLIYTSAIMLILRFFAGSIVSRISPLGLLATAATLAITGLYFLSAASGLFAIFAAATVYGLGKTFFWPTMLGVASEQTPKGGALTLNAIGGIGMLSVGVLGNPLIGAMQEKSAQDAIERQLSVADYAKISTERAYFLGTYAAVDADKLMALEKTDKALADRITAADKGARQGSLVKVTIFPISMLVASLESHRLVPKPRQLQTRPSRCIALSRGCALESVPGCGPRRSPRRRPSASFR